MNTGGQKTNKDTWGQRRPQKTAAEWTVFGVAATLILAVGAILVADWALSPSNPPIFHTQVKAVRLLEGNYHVPVIVENIGNQAAREVHVTAELKTDAEAAKAEETIDFLASDEETTVTFIFTSDPRQGDLSISVIAFREP